MMVKPKDYLKKYADRYRTLKDECEDVNILTRFPDHPEGIRYDIYLYSDTHLAALIPPRAAAHILKKFPNTELVQDASDGRVVIFPEEQLYQMADALKLRRKRRLSTKQIEKLVEAGRQFQFDYGAQSGVIDPEASEITVPMSRGGGG